MKNAAFLLHSIQMSCGINLLYHLNIRTIKIALLFSKAIFI